MAGIASEPGTVGLARFARATEVVLEGVLLVTVPTSVLALASIYHWAFAPLGWVAIGCSLVLAARAAALRALRHRLGARRVALHPSHRWLTLEPTASHGAGEWTVDLGASAWPRPPLLFPGLALAALAGVQLLPAPGGPPLTVSRPDTAIGLAFLLGFLALHESAAVVFASRAARRRFRTGIALLAVVLALVALTQAALGATRIYGLFPPDESTTFFGPFVNRNHFAGYMLLVTPITFDLLGRAWASYKRRLGHRFSARSVIVAIGSWDGRALLYASVPAVAAAGALVATTSRGGILAFAAGIALAGIGVWRGRGVPAWAIAAAFAAMTVLWFGLERLEVRFSRAEEDAPGRTLVWADTVLHMDARQWLVGSGFNTFSIGTSHSSPFALPVGATPWPVDIVAAVERGVRPVYRIPADMGDWYWYEEAHNDYVQLLSETGLPGLLLGLWAVYRVLVAARNDPWLLAAVAGLLLQEIVDFSLQIPAVAVLFAVVTALRR